MTYEEALYILINKISIDVRYTEDFERDKTCLYKCKEALEKQIPKKPIKGFVYQCPICREAVEFEEYYDQPYSIVKYCVICGQALDWSEIETVFGSDQQ